MKGSIHKRAKSRETELILLHHSKRRKKTDRGTDRDRVTGRQREDSRGGIRILVRCGQNLLGTKKTEIRYIKICFFIARVALKITNELRAKRAIFFLAHTSNFFDPPQDFRKKVYLYVIDHRKVRNIKKK